MYEQRLLLHASFFSCESGRSTFPEEGCTLKTSLVVTHKNILVLILNFADVCIFVCFMKFAIHCTAKVKLSLQLSCMLISMQAMEQNQKKKKKRKEKTEQTSFEKNRWG